MRELFYLLILLLILSSCESKLEDGNLDLESVNFESFNAKEFYSDALSANWEDYKKNINEFLDPVYFVRYELDTLDVNGNYRLFDKPYALEYSQRESRKGLLDEDYNICYFDMLEFHELIALTDLQNNLILLETESLYLDPLDVEKVIQKLDNQYGLHQELPIESGYLRFKMYKWVADDKIITFTYYGEFNFEDADLTADELAYQKYTNEDNINSLIIFICKKEKYNDIKKMNHKSGFLSNFEEDE